MSLVRSRIHWDDLAMLDPCWAILSQPEKRHGKWGIKEFFATGADEVSELMNSARQLGLPHEFCRALDFGCGIGRLTHALSSFFGHVTGVDISQPMISRAAALVGKSNCSFVVNSTEFLPFNTETFDLVLSTIVLQHVPDQQAIRNYLAEFGRVLKPSGMLVVQLPSYIPRRRRIQLRPRLYGWLRALGVREGFLYRRLRLHPIPMNFLPESEVRSILRGKQCHVLEMVMDNRAGPHIESRTYFATKG